MEEMEYKVHKDQMVEMVEMGQRVHKVQQV
jgi:hypothetical protein